jgi:meso-butanediol dehydrogenase / (S,S)-butanediol dehydrogenase / diacetyl reductase
LRRTPTAKTALLGFVRSVAVDYGAQGVRVNAVCPGGTRTRMLQEAIDMVAEDRSTIVAAGGQSAVNVGMLALLE